MYRVVIVLFLTFAASGSAWATTFFINNEAGFNTDVSSLTLGLAGTEDWESSSLAAGSLSFISDQIQPGVPHPPFFATGTNAATGLTVQSNTNGNPGNPLPRLGNSLAIASLGYIGTPSDQLSNSVEPDSLDMLFDPALAVKAVSFTPLYFDLLNATATGEIFVEVFDIANASIGTSSIMGVDYQNATSFMGVVAMPGQTIGRINLFDANLISTSLQGVDNIDVWTTAIPPGVPEPGTLALLALGIAGLLFRRKMI